MKTPTFSIVLPVRNGGEQLKQCVASILAQNHADFELLVLENCSADGSAEWLAQIADPRVRIHAAAASLSIEANWARAVEVPKNEFVTFIGHDDLLDPDFLNVMRNLIAAHPDAGVYHAHFRFVDSEGQILGPCRPMPERETAAEFYQALLRFERDANGTGYMVRARDFERVGGFPPFQHLLYADHALWLSLVRDSFLVTAPQECFAYRLHLTSTTSSTRWEGQLKAIKQFITFVQQVETWSEEMKQVTQKLAPAYFLTLCQNLYSVALVQSTKRNQRISRQAVEEISSTLAQIAPQEIEAFKNPERWRLRHTLNAYWWTRSAYIFYILVRYGKGDLPSTR